jgi:predicted TPR repeat methyltransferase
MMDGEAIDRISILFALAGARAVSGDREGSEEGYRAVLELDPAHSEALHQLGNLRREAGDVERAVRLISRSLAVRPGHPYALNNLGGALRDAGKPGHAYLALSAAVDAMPDDPRFKLNLGTVLLDLRRYRDAADVLYEAVSLDPACEEGHHLLASALYRLHLHGAADEATRRARAWLAACPDTPLARHSLAALSDGPPPAAASADWVRATFDRFGPSFDDHLNALSYGVPARIGDLVRESLRNGNARILDLGCGTGLCGKHLRSLARDLVGVDLSPGMLAQAQRKHLYDRLAERDIVSFLKDEPADAWDVMVAADVFIYVGDLGPVLRAAAPALRPGGRFLFSIEIAGDASGFGYELHASGRYRHTEEHVRQAAAAHGLAVHHAEAAMIRMEHGTPVSGCLFIVAKPLDRP